MDRPRKNTLKLEVNVTAELVATKNTIMVLKEDAPTFFKFLEQRGVSAVRTETVGAPFDEFVFQPDGQAKYIYMSWLK